MPVICPRATADIRHAVYCCGNCHAAPPLQHNPNSATISIMTIEARQYQCEIQTLAKRFYRTQQYLLLYRGTPEKQWGYWGLRMMELSVNNLRQGSSVVNDRLLCTILNNTTLTR